MGWTVAWGVLTDAIPDYLDRTAFMEALRTMARAHFRAFAGDRGKKIAPYGPSGPQGH